MNPTYYNLKNVFLKVVLLQDLQDALLFQMRFES